MRTQGYDISAHDWASMTGEPHVVARAGSVGGVDAGGRVGAVIATSGDIAQLDSKIRQLETATDAPGQFAKFTPSLVTDWVAFRADWAQFFADHSGGAGAIPFIIQQDVTDRYTEFVGRYNEMLRRIVDAGVPTSATPSGPHGADKTLLQRFADFVGIPATVAPYAAAGGVAVGAGAVYLLLRKSR